MKRMNGVAAIALAMMVGAGFGTAQDKGVQVRTPAPLPSSGPTYRLTYTVTESEGAKRLGVQHFGLTVTATGQNGSLKVGSKVPITTGSLNGGSTMTSQMTYLDVGLNIRARLTEVANGLVLDSQVEQSTVAEVVDAQSHDPVIRQAVLQNTALLTLGKPVVLGSVDTPGSTRHLEVEVMAELAK